LADETRGIKAVPRYYTTPAAAGIMARLLDEMRQRIRSLHDNLRTVQELLSHADVRTTMIDTHVLQRGPMGVRSPADAP